MKIKERGRSMHPSPEQTEALVQFLEQHPSLAHRFPKMSTSRNRVRKQWQQLAPRLNGIGKSVKTWQQWVKYWSDKKSAIRKKVAAWNTAIANGTNPDLMELSEVEIQILALISNDCDIQSKGTVQATVVSARIQELRPRDVKEERLAEDAGGAGENQRFTNQPDMLVYMSPGPLLQETCAPPSSPPATPYRSCSPASQQAPSRSCSPQADHTPPQYSCSAPKLRRRLRLPGPSRRQGPEPAVQRRLQPHGLTERFLRLEEQRLELERRNTSVLETVAGLAGQLMERDFERERVFAQALTTVGDGLKLLAEAMKKDKPTHDM